MTIKPEVLAAIKAVRKHFDLSMDDETCDAWNTIRAELLAMDARLGEAEALLLRYCVQVGELTKGLDPNDHIFFDLQTLGADYVSYHERGRAMHNSAREVGE